MIITDEMIEAAARQLAGPDSGTPYGELVGMPEYGGPEKYTYFLEDGKEVLEAAMKVCTLNSELLEALEDLANTVGKMPADNKKYPTLFGDLAEARTAIAKAKGETS